MPLVRRASQAEDGEAAKPASRGESRRDGLSAAAAVTLVGAILAAFISGTNLTFELWPSLKPDPKEKVGANLEVLEIDTNVRYDEYAARPGKTVSTNPGNGEIGNVYLGNVFYLRAQIEGFKRESLRLVWFTYDTNDHRRAPEEEARSDRIFEPDAPIETQVAQVWVKQPGRLDKDGFWEIDDDEEGEYFVRFELYSGHVLLAFEDSQKFEVK